MKQMLLLLGLLGAGSLIGATWTVDSNTARPADFRTLQDANDSEDVSPGDVLHVMPSTSSYGSLNLSKGLVMIGPGYLLNANENLNFNVAAPSARMGTLTVSPGADGSLITGMEIAGNVLFNASNFLYANNVTLKRNYIQGRVSTGTGAHGSDIRLLQNYITSYVSFTGTSNSGVLVRGNYIGSYVTLNDSGDSGIFAHNVVDASSGSLFGGSMLVENNLVRLGLSTSASAVARNNWTSSSASGNFTWDAEAEPPVVFADQFVGGNPVDARWQLKIDAAVRETGRGGVDPGMFAGPDPYVLSGLPSVPMVIGVQAPSSASAASGLPITVEVQVNP